ncbi:MAG TPA: homing nuclease, partial [Lactobacillus acetotolerans]|nr:homing nuclease [Lactobacillus acetotolerans]
NRASNLEWCTAKYNANYGFRNKQITKKISKKVAQLTLDGQVKHVWSSAHECARNGFNYGDICACCRGERNVHKGYRWEYV